MTDVTYVHGTPLQIGNETQLLLDDAIVEDRWRLTRALGAAIKHPRNPVLFPDKPWESGSTSSPWIMWDEAVGRYRMWYKTFSEAAYYGSGHFPTYSICYAEIDDGIAWEKPMMDVVTFPGYAKTNVVYAGAHELRVQGTQVVKDPDTSDPNRRYRLTCTIKRKFPDGLHSGVSLVYSPDGLHWQMDESETHLLDYHSDCFNHIVYNSNAECWMLYCRPIDMYAAWPYGHTLPDDQPGQRHMRRRVAVAVSADLKTWSYPRTCLSPDEHDLPDIDSCGVFPYGGRFLMWYNAMQGDGEGWEEVRLASSVDGFRWERFHTREAFIPRGRKGDWDHGQLALVCPPVPHGEHLLLFYGGTAGGQHAGDARGPGCIGVARIKVDRFVEQRAGDEPAFLLTREFLLEGNRLVVNLTPHHRNSSLIYTRVEICRHPSLGNSRGFGQPYEGFSMEDCDPITGDHTEKPVTWRGGDSDLGPLAGKPVYLRFQLRNMGIFSFQIQNLRS